LTKLGCDNDIEMIADHLRKNILMLSGLRIGAILNFFRESSVREAMFLLLQITLMFGMLMVGTYAQSSVADVFSQEKLGKQIFFNPLFSESGVTSCASCHKPEFSFSDQLAFSIKDNEEWTQVATPPLYNLDRKLAYFHDASTTELNKAVRHCFRLHQEMTVFMTYSALKADPMLNRLSKIVYGRVSAGDVYKAVTAYLRSIETDPSRYDLFLQGEGAALTDLELGGLKLFRLKGCAYCHSGYELGGNVLVKSVDDNIEKRVIVPRLRNISVMAPYFYSAATSEFSLLNSITRMKKLHSGVSLTQLEAKQIEDFLQSHESGLVDFEGNVVDE
jgi:cytochrome c peroxidase